MYFRRPRILSGLLGARGRTCEGGKDWEKCAPPHWVFFGARRAAEIVMCCGEGEAGNMDGREFLTGMVTWKEAW